jgi:hypothetical protein
MKTLRLAGSVLVAALTLTACGEAGPTSPTAPGGALVTSSTSPDPTGSGPATPAPTTPPTSTGPTRGRPPSPGSPTTLSGVVREGVEAGCYLIDNYLLVGGPRDVIAAGGRLTVTGRVQADLMTTCQQGIPFVVETATRG